MARTISVADDVYRWMEKKKGDRSFSELIRDMRGETDFQELKDTGVSDGWEKVEEEVKEASEENIDSLEEDYT